MIQAVKNWSTWKQTWPSATLTTTDPSRTDLELSPGFHSERPETSCLSCGMTDTTVSNRYPTCWSSSECHSSDCILAPTYVEYFWLSFVSFNYLRTPTSFRIIHAVCTEVCICNSVVEDVSWKASGIPRNFFLGGGVVQQIQLRTEDRENGDRGAVVP